MSLRRLGIIGCGGIAELVLATPKRELPSPLAQLSILASPRSANEAQQMLDRLGATLAASRTVHTEIGGLVADKLDAVAECASHIAVRDYGEHVLEAGSDLIAISIGALADDSLRARLGDTAKAGGARLVLPSGAIGGIDALAAARLSGLET